MEWVSPDNRIKKIVKKQGTDARKPFLFSECMVHISSDSEELLQFNNKLIIVGENCDKDCGRLLDITLQFMAPSEIAEVTFDLKLKFTIELVSCDHKGYIFEWNAERKMEYADHHKQRGIHLYQSEDIVAASHHFSIALKLLHSIPVDVSTIPESIEEVLVVNMNSIKVKLYNNIALCNVRSAANLDRIVLLSKKALELDDTNAKALNCLGSIFHKNGDIDLAHEYFSRLRDAQPQNIVAQQRLNEVIADKQKAEKQMDAIYRKMFK